MLRMQLLTSCPAEDRWLSWPRRTVGSQLASAASSGWVRAELAASELRV